MICPSCTSKDIRVTHTIPVKDEPKTVRYWKCGTCKGKFKTVEICADNKNKAA